MDIVVDDHTDGLKTLTQEHFSPKINHTEESPFVRGTLLLAGLGWARRLGYLHGFWNIIFMVIQCILII